MKPIKIIFITLTTLAMLAASAFYFFFTSAVPAYEGNETLAGLQQAVTVQYDENGIPHVNAQNELDLFYAQGYLVARERLFQMDMTRLAGRGELSTLFGEATLKKDRFLRTLGLYRHAQKSLALNSDASQKILQAYADGVNAFIAQGKLPREYSILGVSPQPWTMADSLAIGSLMGYSLTRSKKIDLILHKIREQAGDELVQQLIPAFPDFAPTLAQGERIFSHENPTALPPKMASSHNRPALQPDHIFDGFPFPLEIAASNWMIFSGDMSKSGKPLFAGSPDLSPTLPALFYLMHLKAPGIDAIGGVLPGAPGMGPLGFNGHFVYSAVNGRGDELDYFVQKSHPDNENQYLTPDGYKEFEIIEDNIKIKTDDGFVSEPITIKISRHGPIISKVLPNAPANTAMLWSGLDVPNLSVEGLLGFLKAKSFEEFRQAAKNVSGMNLGLGYADVDGNIGWQFTANTPIRKKGKGSLPVPGWSGEYDWQGYVPFEEVPFELNPAKGYVASFNNDPGNTDYYTSNYYLFERAIRFENLMKQRPANKKVDFAELKTMQLDTGSVVAKRWMPLIKDTCNNQAKFQRCSDLFSDWDFKIDMDSEAATLFNAFYYFLMENTLMDDIGEDIWKNELSADYFYYVPDIVMINIKDQAQHDFYDNKNTKQVENRQDIMAQAMSQAINYLNDNMGENWQWGQSHKMPFKHPLGEALPIFNLDPISTPGSHHTINSGFWSNKKPFEMSSGGVIRIMLDFNDLNSATLISPPGQSGHYMSPHYDDLAQIWADGDQIPMYYHKTSEQQRTLMLLPN